MNQRLENALKHTFRLLKHFIVPEPHHAKSAACEIERTLQIIDHVFGVLSSVDLEDKSRTQANQIDDVSTDRHLPPEAVTAQLSIA